MERRLAAILAADVMGFSRQMGADEAGTLARIAALRSDVLAPLLAEHRGRLFKTMGDGFLAEFSSAVQAVACAIAVQARLAEQPDGLRLRIGIHQGDIVVQGEDLMGDGINIAARLEPLAEPGGIIISARVREDLAGKLTVAAEDMGEQALKNISAQVRAFRIRPAAAPEAGPALPDKPSIAVLAFTNMSGDAEQEYFADGIAEDIITALSQIRWLFVIARNSSFTYKGRAVDLKQVGRELGVRYVLEGSVRRAGNRLRITGQLIEAASGTHVWADRFDRSMDDIFAVQDEITAAVVLAIEPAMASLERQRIRYKSPNDLSTWELYQRGLWHLFRYTQEENRQAIECIKLAVARDPDNASVHAALALAYNRLSWMFVPRNDETWLRLGLEHGRIAVNLDPRDANAHVAYASALVLTGQHDQALRETAEAVALNPNNALAQGYRGGVLTYSGHAEEAIPHLQLALRLNPTDPSRFSWVHNACTAYYHMGDYESCLRSGLDLIKLRPNIVHGYRGALVALAELGRLDEAHVYADTLFTRFNEAMTVFLSVRYPEFREGDYAAYCASVAKGGLVLHDGVLTRVA